MSPDAWNENEMYGRYSDQTSLKKSLSSQITEQSGETTKVSEGREEAREAGLDRKSSTWKQGWFTKLTVDML